MSEVRGVLASGPSSVELLGERSLVLPTVATAEDGNAFPTTPVGGARSREVGAVGLDGEVRRLAGEVLGNGGTLDTLLRTDAVVALDVVRKRVAPTSVRLAGVFGVPRSPAVAATGWALDRVDIVDMIEGDLLPLAAAGDGFSLEGPALGLRMPPGAV